MDWEDGKVPRRTHRAMKIPTFLLVLLLTAFASAEEKAIPTLEVFRHAEFSISVKDSRFKPAKEPVVEEVSLQGGAQGVIVIVEGLKESQRASLQIKLVVKNDADSGYI